MKILKNPRFAGCVLLVVLVASMLGGSYRSLNKLAREVEKTFYDSGKENATDTINAQLGVCADAVMGMMTVTDKYVELDDATERLRTARMELISADTIEDKNIAYADMCAVFRALEMAISSAAPEAAEAENWTAYYSDYNSATTLINRLAAEYNNRVNDFPNNVLGIEPQRFEITAQPGL